MTTATQKLHLRQVGMTTACAYELGLDGPNKVEDLKTLHAEVRAILDRYVTGDWGSIDAHDVQVNADALKSGARVMGEYEVRGVTIWVISDAAWYSNPAVREVTTILRPEDY